MKKIVLPLLIALYLTACSTMEEYKVNQRYLVAVLPFNNQSGDKANDTMLPVARDTMISELHRHKRMRLIERERMDAILKEQELSATGLTDSNRAIKLGKLLNVDAVMLGSIASVSSAHSPDKTLAVVMSARVISVNTGEILSTAQTTSNVDEVKFETAHTDTPAKLDANVALHEAVQWTAAGLAYQISAQMPRKNN